MSHSNFAHKRKDKCDPNIFHQGQKVNSFAALVDDLIYRAALDRINGHRQIFVVLGRAATAARLGYCLKTISRAVSRGVELGYWKRAPQDMDLVRRTFGPMCLVLCRKAHILVSDKVKNILSRGTKKYHYPSSRKRRRRQEGRGNWMKAGVEVAKEGFQTMREAVAYGLEAKQARNGP